MEENKWLGLQFFAGEGAPSGGDGGAEAAPGVEAAAPGQENEDLEKLGVPRQEAEKYGAKMKRAPAAVKPTEEQAADAPEGQTPAAEAEAEEKQAKASLAELARTDPEINRELQGMISERVKSFAQARDTLKTLDPALKLIAQSYGMDTSDMSRLDVAALVKNVTEDDRYWEERASEYGVTPDLARKIEGYEQLKAAEEQRERDELQEQQFRAHVGKLMQQAEEMKSVFPDFDLGRELNDPKFKLFTSPQIGMSVKDAYYAIHHEEIRQAERTLIAQKTQEALANNIAAGKTRPQEGGGVKAASIGGISRGKWTRESIEQVKREAEAARARGETYYIR